WVHEIQSPELDGDLPSDYQLFGPSPALPKNACYSRHDRHYYLTQRSTLSMQIACIIRSAAVTGVAVCMMAAGASAATISFNTAQTGTGGTGFNGSGNLVL